MQYLSLLGYDSVFGTIEDDPAAGGARTITGRPKRRKQAPVKVPDKRKVGCQQQAADASNAANSSGCRRQYFPHRQIFPGYAVNGESDFN
jgi:hypothetical protein